ncbi:MAG: Gfo/Idh/MocA family protein [Planctomycetota bacterium]|jgi:predicted dehydrogenase
MNPSAFNRRRFIVRGTAATLAAAVSGSAFGRTHAPSARLRLAGIGIGGMGAADLSSLSSHPNVDVVALCDVDSNRLAEAGEKHPQAKRFSDFRRMFDAMADSIDAVHVSTPDHTHAAAAMTAMNCGKHVYCQKPLTHDIYEARQLRWVAEQKQLVTQMGIQVHSASPYRTAVALVQSGVIGRIRETHSWSNKTWGYDGPDPEPSQVPAHLDWDLWLGTAPERPYSEGHFHPGNWRRWYDFGCGTMGDMAIHILDPVFSALKLGVPRRIVSSSSPPPKSSFGMQNHTRYTFASSTPFTTPDFALTWSDGGMMPDTSAWPTRIRDGKPVDLPDQGSIFLGEKGAILLPHVSMPVLLPQSDFPDAGIEPLPHQNHYHLFADACLGGEPTTAHFGYSGPLTEAVLLGTLANRFPHEEIDWQHETMQIPNHEGAQRLLRRTYRQGFEVTHLS